MLYFLLLSAILINAAHTNAGFVDGGTLQPAATAARLIVPVKFSFKTDGLPEIAQPLRDELAVDAEQGTFSFSVETAKRNVGGIGILEKYILKTMDDFGSEVTNYEKAKLPFFALAYIDLVKAAIKAQQEKEPDAPADFKKDMTDILNYADEKKTLIMQYIGKHVAESGKPFTPPPEFEFTVKVFITWSVSTVNSDF